MWGAPLASIDRAHVAAAACLVCLLITMEVAIQPGFGLQPVALHGAQGKVQHASGIFFAVTPEESTLDHISKTRGLDRQSFQCGM